MKEHRIAVLNEITALNDKDLAAMIAELDYLDEQGVYPDESILKDYARKMRDDLNIPLNTALNLVQSHVYRLAAERFSKMVQA